jgi:hypothetical protein
LTTTSRRPESFDAGHTQAFSVIACESSSDAVWRTVTMELCPLNDAEGPPAGSPAVVNVATGPGAASAEPTNPPNVAIIVTSAILKLRACMRNLLPRSW